MTLSTRRPSKPLTQGQFLTLKSNYGARMGSSVLGSSWENRVSYGEDRRTPLRGAVTGMAPCLGTSSEPWTYPRIHVTLCKTRGSMSLSGRVCVVWFFVLFFLIYANHQEPRTSLLSEDEAGAGGTHRRCLCCWLVWECSRYYVTENRDP